MKKRKGIILLIAVLSLLLVICITAALIISILPQAKEYGFARNVSPEERALRMQVVAQAESWLGASSISGTHRQIIDIYNGHSPLAVGYKVQYTDKWCATFVSTVAIQCNLTDIIPTECGCQRQIALFEEMGCWEEADDYIPLPGDVIFYSSTDFDDEDCGGFSDHVGIVVGTCDGYIKVIEGNFLGAVAYHIIPIGERSIRGYALPNYGDKIS